MTAENNPAPNPTSDAPAAAGALIDIRHLFWVLRERWLGALALVALICGGVGFFLLSRPPVYEASADLLVERSSDRVMDVKQVVDNTVEGNLADALLLTHIEQVRSHSFLSAFCNSLSPRELQAALAAYPAKEPKPGLTPPTEAERLEGFLAKNLKPARTGRTLLISLKLRHQDPAQAEALTNRLAEGYIAYLISRSSERNSAATSFLNTQAEELRAKVEACEKSLQDYREANNLIALEGNQDIVAARVRDLSAALTQARVATLSLSSRLEQAERLITEGGEVLQLARLTEFGTLSQIQKDIDELRTKRAVLAERYGPRHPAMLDNASAIEALGRVLRAQTGVALADLRGQLSKAQAQETRLQEELSEAEKESLRMSQLAVRFNVLKREVDNARSLYTQVLARQSETAITSQLQNTNIKFVNRAATPDRPAEPNKLKIALILALLAGAVGLGYPLGADLLDQRIKLWSDIENYLRLPLVGEIGTLKGVKEEDRDRVVLKDLDERGTEAFRGLYSQLQLGSRVDFPKTLLITSTLPGEGKSFVASNLAAAYAAHGRKVLLVDGDFRRPTLHKGFGLDNKTGMLTWLEARRPVGPDTLRDKELGVVELAPGLSLLRTGGSSRKASELLENPSLAGLMEHLQRSFDLVLIDTPPAGLFPDAEAFSTLADELLFVCRFGNTPRPQASQVLTRLRKTKLAHSGVVLNAMPDEKNKGYYYSSYAYRDYGKYYAERK